MPVRAGDASDFTFIWRQTVSPDGQPEPPVSIGDAPVHITPQPRKNEKEPYRAAVTIGPLRSKTLLYPAKPYQLALVRRGGKLQLFVNGYPDGEPVVADLFGAITLRVSNTDSTARAYSDDEILAHFKGSLAGGHHITGVGHRGVHMHAPENTRISYVQAIEAKTPIVEIDTALSRDGQIVLMHDETVDRTTDGTGNVADLTLEQLKKLDAGSWKDPKYKGEPVPTVDDITDVCRGKATIMFDLKAEGQGKAIAAWLERSKFPRDRVILAPWTDEEGAAIRQHVKDVPMIRLTGKLPTDRLDDAYFDRMKRIGFSGFSVDWRNLSDAFVRAAQKNGMVVYVWTLNDAPDIAGAALLGVDGIVTDDPASTMKLLSQLVPPPPRQ